MPLYHSMPRLVRPHDPGSAPIVPGRWQDASLDAKLFYYAIALNHDGTAHVFTINLSNPTKRQAEKSPLDHRAFVAQRMRDELPGVPCLFCLEVSLAGVLHAHGLLNPLGRDDADIQACLEKVSGDRRKLRSRRETVFIKKWAVDYRPADWDGKFDKRYGPYGWARYMTKNIESKQKALGARKSLMYVCRQVTQSAKSMFHEDVRAGRACLS